MKIENKELKKLNTICFYLIHQCIGTNATKMTIKQDNVTVKKKKVGDWEIIVKKK